MDIENFINYLKNEKNYSKNTIDSYKDDLYKFFEFNNKKDMKNVTEEDIMKYLKSLNDRDAKRASISRKISTLKSFYKYLNFKKIISNNPTTYILYPKREKKLPNYIEYNELESILKSSLEGKNKYRANLIIELLYATGIRVSELVNIKISDIDFNEQSIRVMGKGSKERIVFFGDYALDAINNYINKERNSLSEWLFPNNKNNPLSTRSIELIIDKIMENVSIKSKVSPHTLRHTFATHMLNSGCDIRVVQELLGHENLTTTEVYTHITNEELRNTYLKCHPRNK